MGHRHLFGGILAKSPNTAPFHDFDRQLLISLDRDIFVPNSSDDFRDLVLHVCTVAFFLVNTAQTPSLQLS